MDISIHAPRVGSDGQLVPGWLMFSQFLSTLPAWGATAYLDGHMGHRNGFLSTLPAWGATTQWCDDLLNYIDFYPRSPRGERRR